MTDKELRHLNRRSLLELLLQRTEENERLTAELEEVKKQLGQRSIAVDNAGSLAEAAVSINGMLSAADETAKQYLENIQKTNETCEALKEKAQSEADSILRNAKALAENMVQKAKLEAEKVSVETRLKAEADYRREQEQRSSETIEMKQDLNRELSAAFAQMRKRNNH